MRGFVRIHGAWVIFVVLAFAFFTAPTLTAQKPKTAGDFVKDAKKRVAEITVAQAKAKIDSSGSLVILDVREPSEFKRGHIPKAINIPRGLLEWKVSGKIPNRDAHIIVYCKSGGRACLGTDTLLQMGYKNVVNMAGGWKA